MKFLEYVNEKVEASLSYLSTWQRTTTYSYIYSQNFPLALLHDTVRTPPYYEQLWALRNVLCFPRI